MIKEKITTSLKFIKDKQLKNNVNIDLVAQIIEKTINNPNRYQFFIDFVFGYLYIKPKALSEDLEMCVDTAKHYRQSPELFENYKNLKPIELGKLHDELREIVNSKIIFNTKNKMLRLKAEGRLLDGMSLEKIYQDSKYKFYYIPPLPQNCSKQDKDKQHILYCAAGKGTNWCTACPTGTYYEDYVHDHIFVVNILDKPSYQFNVRKDKVMQFMDADDESVGVLPKTLIDKLEKLIEKTIKKNETISETVG
jgi:hypothetical protein